MKTADKRFIILLIVCVFSLVAMFFTLCKEPEIQIEFTPPPFEENAEKGIPSVPKDLGWEEFDAKAFKFSICGKVFAEKQKAAVWFTNPENNTVWLKLRIIDIDGNIIGESGIIRPGEYIKNISLTGEISKKTPVILKVMSYEPETYYSEGAVSLNTNIRSATE